MGEKGDCEDDDEDEEEDDGDMVFNIRAVLQ